MGPAEEIQTFERPTLIGKRYFFRIIDCGNNEILAQSQTYKTRKQRDKTAIRLSYGLGCAVVPGRPR
jgi:hypothetical protein